MDKMKLDTYLVEAQSWETSAVQTSKKITRMALAVGAAGLIFGLLGGSAALVQYNKPMPMPVVLWGDKSLGRVDQVQSLADGKLTTPEATDKYFAQLYVQYRESWDPEVARKYDRSKSADERAQGNYYRAALMSIDAEQRRYEAFYRSDHSPVKVLGDNAKAHVRFRGTTLLRPGVALVRYERVVERTGTVQPEVTHHTATVSFGYSNGPMSERDRAIDPLGFQSSDYRTDPDVPEAVPLVATPAPYPATQTPAAPASGTPLPASLDLRPLQARGQ